MLKQNPSVLFSLSTDPQPLHYRLLSDPKSDHIIWSSSKIDQQTDQTAWSAIATASSPFPSILQKRQKIVRHTEKESCIRWSGGNMFQWWSTSTVTQLILSTCEEWTLLRLMLISGVAALLAATRKQPFDGIYPGLCRQEKPETESWWSRRYKHHWSDSLQHI